jgi:hypothetical protein
MARGAAFLGVLVLGFLVGGGVVFLLHEKNYIGDEEPRQVAAFSEVPEAQAGALAERFRPWLKFDSEEAWRPLNIAHLLEERSNGVPAHLFCPRAASQDDCTGIGDEADFRQQAQEASALGDTTYIDIAGGREDEYRAPGGRCIGLADCGAGPGSAIYYHVLQSNDRFYIDYWWFLRFNNFYLSHPNISCRSETARETGACGEHEGDWEGVTVVTQPGDDEQVDYVVFAAHSGTFRYAASELRLRDQTRPEVYVARGSHASYPQQCSGGCTQPIAVEGLVTLPEGDFDGNEDWERNSEDCAPGATDSCLLPLPRTDDDPQAWTVWPGRWGAGCEEVCGGQPGPGSPRSPGLQARYQTPWCSAQGRAFTCDGAALGCSDWLGPLVVAVACDPALLAEGLRDPSESDTGGLSLTVRGEEKTTESTAGVVQALGDPLEAGDTVAVKGSGEEIQVLIRAQEGQFVVEARFDRVNLEAGEVGLVEISSGAEEPNVLLDGHRPVERRIHELDPLP